MKQKYLLIFGITTALSLTGCGSGSTNTETEALEEQILQLQQQISDLEQQLSTETASDTASSSADQNTESADEALSSAPEEKISDPSGGSDNLSTTHTMEELTAMVTSYEEQADAAVPSGTAADDMEQFFSLKQEEKKIDDNLDLHEDELEYLYRSGSLSRDEYKTMERELEYLEDRLDATEDKLEYTFGIDD